MKWVVEASGELRKRCFTAKRAIGDLFERDRASRCIVAAAAKSCPRLPAFV